MIRFGRRDDRVSARNVTAYRLAAGEAVLRGYGHTERLLEQAGAPGRHPWQAGEPVGLRLAMVWAVQCCLLAADRMTTVCLHEDGADGWLPAVAAARIEEFYSWGTALVGPVEQLLAAGMPPDGGALPGGGALPRVPVPLPGGGPRAGGVPSEAEVAAVLALAQAVVEQVAAVLAQIVEGHRPPGEFRPWVDRLRQRYAGLRATVEQQQGLWLGRPDGLVRAELVDRLLGAAADGFRLGQAVLLPRIEDPAFTVRPDRAAPVAGSAAGRELDRLRQWLGFDPAVLTAPELRAGLDGERLHQLDVFWRADPDPQVTAALQRRLEAEQRAGRISRRGTEALRDCPWSPVYLAVTTVDVGERIGRGTIFALRPGPVGGVFTHQLLRLGTDAPSVSAGTPSMQVGAQGDLWRLTDVEVAARRRGDAASTADLARLWAADDDPGTTAALVEQLTGAVAAGIVRRRPRKALWSCPWPSTYLAVRRLSLGGERIGAGEVFALTVHTGDGGFARQIVRIGRISDS